MRAGEIPAEWPRAISEREFSFSSLCIVECCLNEKEARREKRIEMQNLRVFCGVLLRWKSSRRISGGRLNYLAACDVVSFGG